MKTAVLFYIELVNLYSRLLIKYFRLELNLIFFGYMAYNKKQQDTTRYLIVLNNCDYNIYQNGYDYVIMIFVIIKQR